MVTTRETGVASILDKAWERGGNQVHLAADGTGWERVGRVAAPPHREGASLERRAWVPFRPCYFIRGFCDTF